MQTELNLLLIGLAWGLYYFLHSFFASTRCKEWGRSRLGQKKYRLFYNLGSVLGLCGLLLGQLGGEHRVLWGDYLGGQILGCLLLCAGLIIGFSALRAYDLGEFSGLGERLEEDTPLVVRGLNAYVRHPLYSAILVFVIGLGLLWPRDTLWVTIGITIVYVFWGSELEEQKLIERYGEAYLNYRQSVKRLIPGLL
ncbi:MAG: isoprenylcysteine carboxylmethyltransferase family protein [Bacteroidota bacterium]